MIKGDYEDGYVGQDHQKNTSVKKPASFLDSNRVNEGVSGSISIVGATTASAPDTEISMVKLIHSKH